MFRMVSPSNWPSIWESSLEIYPFVWVADVIMIPKMYLLLKPLSRFGMIGFAVVSACASPFFDIAVTWKTCWAGSSVVVCFGL